MKANQIKEIRAQLMRPKNLTFVQTVELRARLEAHSKAHYCFKNSPAKIIAFINQYGNGLQLRKVHPTDVKVPYVWQLFTTKSQWVCGDSPAECFDKAIALKGDWTKVSTTDVNSLIMAHQAIKDAKTENTVQVAEVS